MSDPMFSESFLPWRLKWWCQELVDCMLDDVTNAAYSERATTAHKWIRFYEDLITTRMISKIRHASGVSLEWTKEPGRVRERR